jgi:hypothetical protein
MASTIAMRLARAATQAERVVAIKDVTAKEYVASAGLNLSRNHPAFSSSKTAGQSRVMRPGGKFHSALFSRFN